MPAGLPVIDDLTRDFSQSIAKEKEMGDAHKLIETVFRRTQGTFDIELELHALTELTERPTGTLQYFYGTLESEVKKFLPLLPELKSRLKQFVRSRCQDPGDVSFLRPLLLGFTHPDSGIDIFTLNYDPTIEALCESENLAYTDGFDPYWNPKAFESKGTIVRLFKIHGSVNWFLIRPGWYAKIPVRGDIQHLKFFTGEQLTEMVLYPALEKRTDSGPYPYILNAFRTKLAKAGLLITIGYSFRDNNIRTLIIDQMRANPGLWLILASPHAQNRRAEICKEAPDLKARIVAFNADAELSIAKRMLAQVVGSLRNARVAEERARSNQATSARLLDYDWRPCIADYESLGHYEKIKQIGHETLLNDMLDKGNPSLEPILARMSLRFAIEDFANHDMSNAAKWLALFRDYLIVADDQLFRLYTQTGPDAISLANMGGLIGNREPNARPFWIRQGVGVDLAGLSKEIENLTDFLTNTVADGGRSTSIAKKLKPVHALCKLTIEANGLQGNPMAAETFKVTIPKELQQGEGGFYSQVDKLLTLVQSWKS